MLAKLKSAIAIYICFLLVGIVSADDKVDIKTLINDVSSKDKETVLKAIDSLGKLGSNARPAVGALTKALSHDDDDVRARAAEALGSVGPGAASAVNALAKALSDEEPSVRAYAAFALGAIGEPAEPAVDELIRIAFDEDALVRRASIRALLNIDPPQEKTLPFVLKVLKQGDMSIIMPALHTLAEEGKKAVPRLRKLLEHEEASYWACLALAEIGPDAAEAVPEITVLAKHDDPDIRLQALIALGEIGESSKSAIPVILDAFQNDAFQPVRYAAAYAIGKVKAGGASEEALLKSLDSDDEFLRTIAAWGLARMNPENKKLVNRAVGMIVAAFKSEDVNVRRAAARAVVEFDVPRDVVAPALVEALKDKDPTVVANAIEALAGFGAKALKHIDDGLKNEDLRHYAVMLVMRLGPEADSAVPALIDVMQKNPTSEEDIEFQREVQFALASIGPGAKDAVRPLVDSLSSTNDQIRASASYALGKIGPEARAAVPKLRENLSSESPIVKLASVRALLEIQPRQPQLAVLAAPLLVKALGHENELVRAEAASALGDLGPLGKRATPKLKELLDDESEIVRQAAEDALKKLNG